MTWGFSRRALFGLVWLMAVVGTASLGCGDELASEPAPPESDSSDTDADASTDAPRSVLDADLPQSSVVVTADASGEAGADAGAYTLAPNSITTCGQFFSCLQDCDGDHDSCMSPCNEAMTVEAARMVHIFMNCVAQSGCRSGGCISQRCGAEAQACFSSPY